MSYFFNKLQMTTSVVHQRSLLPFFIFPRQALLALLSCVIAVCVLPAARAAEPFTKGQYAPVGVAFLSEVGEPVERLLLLGGSQGDTWYRQTDLPITVQGAIITPKNAMDFENGEDMPCETPLATPATSMTIYSMSGRLGEASIKRTLFFTHPSSGEIFVAAELSTMKQPARGLVVGVSGNWNAMPVKTSRTEENGNITFSVTSGDESTLTSVVLSKTKNAGGEVYFKGDVVVHGKIFDAGSFYTDDPHEISGFFIDLNGDGQMEFVLYVEGIAGSASVFSIAPNAVTEVMNLDFGD